MPSLTPELRQEYASLFDSCQIRPERKAETDQYVNGLVHNKNRYQVVADRTDVPWYIIGVIHHLESTQNFQTHLHNGDPLTARTVQEPAGRPPDGQPPFNWEVSAVDALVYERFDRVEDWTLTASLYHLERFNGFGSRNHGIKTPYLWSFSTHYTKGKYTADGMWSSTAVSQQCGTAVLLRRFVDRQEISFPANVPAATADEIKTAGALVPFSNTNKTLPATRLQKLINRFPGLSNRVTPDGVPGNKTSSAFKEVTGSYLAGDPRI